MVRGGSSAPASHRASASASSRAAAASSEPPSACPATRARPPAPRGASRRASTPASTCSATVRPNRASHALGIGSAFSIVPVATRSAMAAPCAFESLSLNVSGPSSWASSSTATATVFARSPTANVSVPLVAV